MHKPLPCGLAILALAMLSRATMAQIGRSFHSIEWMTASADVVVRGAVVSVVEATEPVQRGEPLFHWMIVTVKVEAALKGKPLENIVFALQPSNFASSEDLAAWKASAEPLLWFFARNDKETIANLPAGHPQEAEGEYRWSERPIPLQSPKGKTELAHSYFTMDLRQLHDAASITQAVKAEAERDHEQRSTQSARISVPRFMIQDVGTAGDANDLELPVNAELERLAKAWLQSPEQFIKMPADWKPANPDDQKRQADWVAFMQSQLRVDAVRTLRFFKSDENTALLKPLLADSVVINENRTDGTFRVHILRRAAWDVLSGWGVQVTKPEFEERVTTP